jgi:hypothetical protein
MLAGADGDHGSMAFQLLPEPLRLWGRAGAGMADPDVGDDIVFIKT